MAKREYKRKGYLRITSETHDEKKEWNLARIEHLPERMGLKKQMLPACWMVHTDHIGDDGAELSAEFFDTFDDALAFAKEHDVIIWEKEGDAMHHDLKIIPSAECFDNVYSDHARKMDVNADENGNLRIYTDLWSPGAGAREINLTKEQAMWLMEFLPEAVAAMPEFGWEDEVRKQIRNRRKKMKAKATE